jgi:hypothetical protein
VVLMRILDEGVRGGAVPPDPGDDLPDRLRPELARITAEFFPDLPIGTLARGMTGWAQLFGVLSFELFGRFANTIEELDAYFEHQMTVMADLMRLP